jgi:hypothetical protein
LGLAHNFGRLRLQFCDRDGGTIFHFSTGQCLNLIPKS